MENICCSTRLAAVLANIFNLHVERVDLNILLIEPLYVHATYRASDDEVSDLVRDDPIRAVISPETRVFMINRTSA